MRAINLDGPPVAPKTRKPRAKRQPRHRTVTVRHGARLDDAINDWRQQEWVKTMLKAIYHRSGR